MRNITSSLALVLGMTGVSMLTTGCLNVFGPIDSPSGDAQLLSAARACFDRGDFTCAQSNYQKLSTDQADISANEQAMATLDQNGAGMGSFLTFVGNGANGTSLTAMAEGMAPGSATKRAAIYQAFLRSGVANSTRTQLQYFTQFMTGLALAAEILAEVQGSNSQLLKTAISANAASCSGGCTCTTTTSLGNSATADIKTTEPTGTVTADMLYWAINYAYSGMTQLNPTGSFATTSSGLNTILGSSGKPSTSALVDACFRGQVFNFGIGR